MLINEPQWVGIIARPINYSLKGAVLYVDTGPGLKIEDLNFIEMESYDDTSKSSVGVADCNGTPKDGSLAVDKIFEKLTFCDDRVSFPHWASNLTSILWIPLRAISENLARGSSLGCEHDANLLFVFLYFICCKCSLLHPTAYLYMVHHVLLQWLPRDTALWME